MNQNKNAVWRDPLTIAWLVLGAFLLVNVAITAFKPLNKFMNPDEMQHIHIAWLIAHGDIIYRDFWEHHGPVYGLLNGALVYLTNAEPTLRILYWSRFLSLLVTGFSLYFTWLIARNLSLSRIGAFIAVVALSATFVTQTRGIEMRPDPLQSLFWIAGLYCLIRNQNERNLKLPIAAGALFTLSILANAKAGLGPFFVVVYYLTGHWLCDLKWADTWRDMRGMVIGACIAAFPFIVYFLANGALIDFLYYSFWWNLEVVFYWSATELHFENHLRTLSVSAQNLRRFITEQAPFLLLSLVGTLYWVARLRKTEDAVANKRNWLFLIATFGASLGWLLDLYTQYFLMFLPLWAILVSVAITSTVQFIADRYRPAGIAVAAIIAVASIAGMIGIALELSFFYKSQKLIAQEQFTERFVELTERDEPAGLIWSQCGGYMFNEHVGYYWAALSDIDEIVKAMTGEHPHGQGFIDEMEERRVNYVIGMDAWSTDGMSDEAMGYLRENFRYTECLWTRKKH
ncbi:MAG: ArnT family glycosyltransferase [Gammaproteobacteria bacterium]